MWYFASEIIADAHNVELELFKTEEQRRQHLVTWFNDHVANGGLGEREPVPEDTSAEAMGAIIEAVIGRTVILSEVRV